jgi:hypothetical protein
MKRMNNPDKNAARFNPGGVFIGISPRHLAG